jgi:hypothetical protein
VNYYYHHVEAVLRATRFLSPTSYSWFGKQLQPLPRMTKRALNGKTARDYLLFTLQSQLYSDFYVQGVAAPAQREPAEALTDQTAFVDELSAANCGTGHWEDGWAVHAAGESEIIVRRGRLKLWVRPQDCLVPRGTPVAPGLPVSLRFPNELLNLSPGYYLVLSDQPFSQRDSSPLVRWYWNLTAAGAVPFLRQATARLNEAGLPFKLKVVNDSRRFTRCDSGVLYTLKSDRKAVAEVLAEVYANVANGLRRQTPVFTKQLAPGVGLAEDPVQRESFGQHRCGLLADGMIRAYERGKRSLQDRLAVVIERFAEDGISLETPFLNPGSDDDYAFQELASRKDGQLHSAMTSIPAEQKGDLFLQTAREIGQRLMRDAVWHGDRCNWLGAEPREYGPGGATYRALGPEIYSGTSGVALFLAELYAATRDPAVRRTARGAIRHALSGVDAVLPSARLGHYTGWVGIAYAAARVGMALDEEAEFLEYANGLLRRAASEKLVDHEFDIISGNAGAIAALQVLRNNLDEPALFDFAVRLADELLRGADTTSIGYSWRSVASPKNRNLTGFSHGTAGIGYALLELFQATRDSKYRHAAQQAFEYERHWFDVDEGNWPDFRGVPAKGRRSKHNQSFAMAWCHGAPGIALARLRAYEILNDETCKAEAVIALQTTRTMIETALQSGTGNYSLCHGLAGNAETLLYASRVLDGEWADAGALALEVGKVGAERFAAPQQPWPCGTYGGETPSLMLGLAGIGYFYLRLHDPTKSPVLMGIRPRVNGGKPWRVGSARNPPLPI